MRKKLESLPITELREIAKKNGIKSVTTMRKAMLVDRIIEVTGDDSAEVNKTANDSVNIPGYSMTTVNPTQPQQTPAPQPVVNHTLNTASARVSQPYASSAYNTSTYEPKQRNYDRFERSYDRGRTYDRGQQGYDRSQQGYDRSQQGFDRNQQGYDRSQQGYDRSQQGFDRSQQGFDRSQQGFDRSQQGFDRSQQGFDRSQQGFDRSQQGFDRNQQGFDRSQQNFDRSYRDNRGYERTSSYMPISDDMSYDPSLDSGIVAHGILEVMSDGFGFIRCENYMPGENDIYVSPMQIRKFNLKTGDIVDGKVKIKTASEKFAALLYIASVNGYSITDVLRRPSFENLTPINPNERIRLETDTHNTAMRITDIVSPIGKGQRGMIVSPPKAGKTTLLKEVAKAIQKNNPDMHMLILLIDERPEEVTDIKEAIEGTKVEVIYSTFDEPADHHKRVAEMVIERGKRLVEHGQDVVILLDSITRLARAYNLIISPSGRTLSGGLDPAALTPAKKFFGAARNMREGGSLTILATALVDTGSRMDDVVFEEFKGTGNMELVLDRSLSEKRVFPAIDILKSGTRRDDLLLSAEEMAASDIIKKISASAKPEDAVESVLNLFANTKDNNEFCNMIIKQRF